MRRLLIGGLLVLAGWAPLAQGATVYRCGPPESRSYSQTPCDDAEALRVADARTPEQQAAARTAHQAEQSRAERLQRDRQQGDAQAPARAARLTVPTRKAEAAASRTDKAGRRAAKGAKKKAGPFSERFISPPTDRSHR